MNAPLADEPAGMPFAGPAARRHDTGLDSVAAVRRDDIEDFKVRLANQPHPRGDTISPETHRQRQRMVRSFFERIIEWDWPDAPARNPVMNGDIPKKPEPQPRFLDDQDAARFMTVDRAAIDPRDRLVDELLASTSMRAGELAGLEADSVVQIGGNHWLRIPLSKLRNDRYVPLDPQLVTLLTDWTAANLEHIRAHNRLVPNHRGALTWPSLLSSVASTTAVCATPTGPYRSSHRHVVLFARLRIFGRDDQPPRPSRRSMADLTSSHRLHDPIKNPCTSRTARQSDSLVEQLRRARR